jgi:O-antigen/teichoic acid export membrane protein
MLLFTVVELINKVLGLYITGYLARILPATSLGHYLSGLIMLGYALELAFFGAQNRNNAEYAVHQDEYLSSRRFAARKTLTSIASLAGAIFLLVTLRSTADEFTTAPLLLVLVCVPLTFDFVAYGSGHSQIIVIGRLVSQLVAVGWISLVARGYIAAGNLYWGQLLQTASLTVLIAIGVLWLGRVRAAHFAIGLTRFPSQRADMATALVDQWIAFLLRIFAMAAVSSELLVLTIADGRLSSDLATALRLVQVFFPFVVFYIDSRVREVDDKWFARYALLIGAATIALVIASPVLVRVLYGPRFMSMSPGISAFAPALAIQALCQFQVIATLKTGTERQLIRRLVIPTLLSSVALVALIAAHVSLRDIALLYTVKAVVFAILIPRERKAKWIAASSIVVAAGLNVLFWKTGYYDAVAALLP